MKSENEVCKIQILLFIFLANMLSIMACHQEESYYAGDFQKMVVFTQIIAPELRCQEPNAIRFSSGCITQKVSSGLIYDNATGLPISTASVTNGTQLECRGLYGSYSEYNLWYKSDVKPIPIGYSPVFIAVQEVNKDSLGKVMSYKPFTNYSSGDFLICATLPPLNPEKAYQVIEIQ